MINPFKSKKGLGRGLSSLIGDDDVKISDNKISSNGKFTSVICLDTGDLHLYALDVENKEVGFELIPKVMYFSDAIVYRWKNIKEIDDVRFDFY